MGDFTRFWLETTALDLEKISGRKVDRSSEPPRFKNYPGAESIPLPALCDIEVGQANLWEALHARRSVRRYAPGPISKAQLTALLWSVCGVTARQAHYLLRPAPSAGALYPFETYVFINDVEGCEPCLAHLNVQNFALEVVRKGPLGSALAAAALGQRFLASAQTVFAFSTVPGRAEWKYGDRASRYLGLDIGHLCQDLCLSACALGLGSCAVGAFLDGKVNGIMELDGSGESAFYLCAVGKPA